MYQRWQNILREDFIKNNKWLVMNCTIDEYCNQFWNGGIPYGEPSEYVIQEYATYNKIDLNVARKYFNKYCMNGCLNRRKTSARLKDKETLGMNLKMFGRSIEKFKCKNCLMKEFNWTKEEWDKQIEDFKEQGCKLF